MNPTILAREHETVHPGGEHIACTGTHLAELFEQMLEIHDVEFVHPGCKLTSSMMALVQGFRRLSVGGSSDDDAGATVICCDISDAWEQIRKNRVVLAGTSAGGGTLYLAFVRKEIAFCTVEANCNH
jgi:hypothetical protein